VEAEKTASEIMQNDVRNFRLVNMKTIHGEKPIFTFL
tara:strand:+ start:1425 stop:1535 length:111 start_codon:yes stop_codon:yes gene_type:complete